MTSSVCQPNSPKLQCWKWARWSRNPVWPTDGVHQNGRTVKNVKRYQPVKNACAVTKFRQLRHLKFKARLSWITAVVKMFAVEFNCVGNNFLETFLKWLLFGISRLFCLYCNKIFLIAMYLRKYKISIANSCHSVGI